MIFNQIPKGWSQICLASVLFAGLSTCSHSDSVKQYIAEQTNPFNKKHVTFAVYSKIQEGTLSLFFSLQTPRNELTFHQTPTGFSAAYSVRLNVKTETGDVLLDTLVRGELSVSDFSQTRAFILEKRHIPLPLSRGVYHIDGLFIDENSKSELVFSSGYTIDPKEYPVQLSSLRFQETAEQNDISLTKRLSFGSGKKPGLNFEIDSQPGDSEKRVQVLITRLRADTLTARPIWGINPIEGTIETRGYKLHNPLYSFALLDSTLSGADSGTRSFRIQLPDTLQEGVFEGQILVRSADQVFTSKKELFYLFPKGFPYFRSIKEAAAPLKYLATQSELEALYSGGDSLLKENFDRFWLKLSNNNLESAKRKIALYYQRAEEANFLFSMYKPGWKTDLGMLYIFLGPPEMVEWKPTKLTWYYFYRRAGGRIPLEFNPIRVDNVIVGYSFDRYSDNYFDRLSYYTFEDFWLEYRREWEKNN